MAMLPVVVAAVREGHYAAAIQCALRPAVHILNKVFDSDITLLAVFVTAVGNSSSYDPTPLSFFRIFLSILLWSSNSTENVLFYKVKWQH